MKEQPAEAVRDVVRLPFPDRRGAGRVLAAALRRRFTGPDGRLTLERPLVLALPRGGVAVAAEVALDLGVPLDVLVTRKIGYPQQPELGVGALAEGGEPVYDDAMLRELGIEKADLAGVVARERAELARRVEVYRGGRPAPDVRDRSVILTDDGLATGVTARAALRAIRAARPARVVLAVPVGSPGSVAALAAEADDIVALALPRTFHAVGEWYTSFGQLTDADVLALLSEAAAAAHTEATRLIQGTPPVRGESKHPLAGDPADGQAAFARRIRRRRSDERSSSFWPPQVPYFSGRATA